MCYDEGHLLAYLDDEAPEARRAEIAAHIAECHECAGAVARLDADRAVAADALARLQPTADVVALAARRAPAGTAPAPVRHWGRYAAVAAAAALLLASFSFAPVRSAAADLLHVFRVQNVQTVSLTQADLESIGNALESGSGHVDLKSMGEAWIDGAGAEPKPATFAEAQAAVDFPLKLPAAATGKPTIMLEPAQTYKFKLNVSAINKALQAYGSERTLPDGLDGKVFSVRVAPIVLASYETPGANDGGPPESIYLGQGRSPELVVPDGVDAGQLRDVLLNLPFLPQGVRDQLAAVTDWQSTLIIPNVGGTARDITIDGVSAVVMSPQGPFVKGRNGGQEPVSATVIWNSDGVVRALGGPVSEEKAIELAKSTMK